jgi:hypothetical protein
MRKLMAGLATAVLLVAFMPAAAAARPAAYVYHGTLTGGELFDCIEGSPWPYTSGWVDTSGIWSATISPGVAEISGNEFHDFGDGWVHWTSMGGASWGKWDVIGTPAPGSFHLRMADAFGGTMQIDVTLSDGQLMFLLEPYGYCAKAEVYGEVTWSNPGAS